MVKNWNFFLDFNIRLTMVSKRIILDISLLMHFMSNMGIIRIIRARFSFMIMISQRIYVLEGGNWQIKPGSNKNEFDIGLLLMMLFLWCNYWKRILAIVLNNFLLETSTNSTTHFKWKKPNNWSQKGLYYNSHQSLVTNSNTENRWPFFQEYSLIFTSYSCFNLITLIYFDYSCSKKRLSILDCLFFLQVWRQLFDLIWSDSAVTEKV